MAKTRNKQPMETPPSIDLPKSRVKQFMTEDLGIPVSGCRQFGRELGIRSADTYGKIWAGNNSGISFAILGKIFREMGLNPDTTPFPALIDFGTGYKATSDEVLRLDARGREIAARAAAAKTAKVEGEELKKRKRRKKGGEV